MNDLSVNQLGAIFTKFIKRFHATIFILVVLIGLIAAVWILNQTVTKSTTENTAPTTSSQSFDKNTIEKIQQLRDGAPSSTNLPSGRINPFVE